MGEHVMVGDSVAYAADVWEYETDSTEKVPAQAYEAVCELLSDLGVHEVDLDDVAGRLVQILGPAITGAAFRHFLRINSALFLNLPTEFVRNVIKDQDRRLAEQLG